MALHENRKLIIEIEWKIQTETQLWTSIFFFWKKPEIRTIKKTAPSPNGACQTGWLYVEECELIHIYHPAQK